MKMLYQTYNFDTEEYDSLEALPNNEGTLLPYLPKDPNNVPRLLFSLKIKLGASPLIAYRDVLECCVGKRQS